MSSEKGWIMFVVVFPFRNNIPDRRDTLYSVYKRALKYLKTFKLSATPSQS